MKKQELLGSGMLLLTALIWGTAFVAQSVAMDYMQPFTFGALRYALGALTLTPVMAVTAGIRRHNGVQPTGSRRDLWLGGCLCGVLLFLASASQQIGIQYTSVGRSGFITALYVVLVPIGALVVFRRPLSPLVAVSVAAAVAGLYLLCWQDGPALNRGDVYTAVCAVFFTAQILAMSQFAPRVDGVKLSFIQFAVCAALNAVAAVIREPAVPWSAVTQGWLPLLYAGVMSSGVAYTMQTLGQKRTPPAVASVLMSMESVFAAIAGAVILGQWLSVRETVGCVLMFAAVILAQVPLKRRGKNAASSERRGLFLDKTV